MADALVKLLNSLGYQPVFMPRSGVQPPELYNVSDKGLVRRGPLAHYLPQGAELSLEQGRLGDIAYKQTSGKRAQAAVSFLENALRCIGVTSVPKLDLSFTSGSLLAFSFSKVTYLSISPSRLDHLLRSLETGAIPEAYLERGLHVVYEYIYADTLLMSRADSAAFDGELAAKLASFVDLGPSGTVKVESTTAISFASSSGAPAAFAYKAGRLERTPNAKWEFYPEEVLRGRENETRPYLVRRGSVLRVEEDGVEEDGQ